MKHSTIKIDTAIYNVLRNLGARCDCVGYKYVCTFIKDCFENNGEINNISDWYTATGEKVNKEPSTIERNIRHLVTIIDTNTDEYIKIFGANQPKTSNKNFLYTVYQYIKAHMYDGIDSL